MNNYEKAVEKMVSLFGEAFRADIIKFLSDAAKTGNIRYALEHNEFI